MGYPMRIELTRAGLLVYVANHYTIRGAQDSSWSGNTLIHQKRKKFWTQRSVKKVMLTALWKMERSIAINFLEKDATINNANSLGKIQLFGRTSYLPNFTATDRMWHSQLLSGELQVWKSFSSPKLVAQPRLNKPASFSVYVKEETISLSLSLSLSHIYIYIYIWNKAQRLYVRLYIYRTKGNGR